MEQFLSSQVEITYVLSLYPSIVLPKSAVIPTPENLTGLTRDASSYLPRGSSGLSDDMEYSSPQPLEPDDIETKKMSHNTLMALTKFLQKKRFSIIEKATAEGTEVVLGAVGEKFSSNYSTRSRRTTKNHSNSHISSGARDMAAILDTALLQALLLTGRPSAALELLKCPNYCDVKICEEVLQKRNQYAALLELYKSNEMHREALEMLSQLVEESKAGAQQPELTQKFKPEMIIEYLKPLCGTDPILVLEFSMLVHSSIQTTLHLDIFILTSSSAKPST